MVTNDRRVIAHQDPLDACTQKFYSTFLSILFFFQSRNVKNEQHSICIFGIPFSEHISLGCKLKRKEKKKRNNAESKVIGQNRLFSLVFESICENRWIHVTDARARARVREPLSGINGIRIFSGGRAAPAKAKRKFAPNQIRRNFLSVVRTYRGRPGLAACFCLRYYR